MMLEETIPPCPACNAPDSIRGHLGDGRPGTFSVSRMPFLSNAMVALIDRSTPGSAHSSATAHACAECGLVWTHVDLEGLRRALAKRKKP